MTNEGFQVGDEIEWRAVDGNRTRVRGRVVANADGLAACPYDDLRRPADGVIAIQPGTRHTSGTDLLAELVPDLYHLLDDEREPGNEAETCRCGALDRKGAQLRPLDPAVMHHATYPSERKVWDKLVRHTATALDGTDRSLPLDERQLPEGSADQARELRLCARCFRLAVLGACYPEEPAHQSDEDLRAFVLAWMDRRIYSHLHCPQRDVLPMVFMCMMLMPPIPEDYAEKVGLIYEYLSAAGPRGVNGQPSFFSHRLLHVDDWERVKPAIEAEEDRRKNLVI